MEAGLRQFISYLLSDTDIWIHVRFGGGYRSQSEIASCGVRIQCVQSSGGTVMAHDVFRARIPIQPVDSYTSELEGASHAVLYARQFLIRLLDLCTEVK